MGTALELHPQFRPGAPPTACYWLRGPAQRLRAQSVIGQPGPGAGPTRGGSRVGAGPHICKAKVTRPEKEHGQAGRWNREPDPRLEKVRSRRRRTVQPSSNSSGVSRGGRESCRLVRCLLLAETEQASRGGVVTRPRGYSVAGAPGLLGHVTGGREFPAAAPASAP